MKFFIDTANISEINTANELCILDGVTTNPSLMAKENIKGKDAIMNHYKKICDLVAGDVSAEVIGKSFEEMVAEGLELAALHKQIVVKLPLTKEGIKACKFLTNKNIKTNVTLVFSATQALLAAKAGATYVSPFIGRLDDISTDGMMLIKDIRTVYDNYRFPTQILAASIRNPIHILNCAKARADVITSPLAAIEALLKHPLTEIGLEKFLADHAKNNFS